MEPNVKIFLRMKPFFLIIFFLIQSIVLSANVFPKGTFLFKDSVWNSSGVFSLGIGQTSFTNWSAGGDNNVNVNASLFYDLNFKKDIINWNNNFDIKYGTLVFLGKKPKKTNDQIHMSSKLGYEIDSSWSFSLLYNFDSQFSNGYKYPNDSMPISRFMAPGYLMLGVGADYKPNGNLSVLISPFSNKVTIVNDAELANKGSFGLTPAEYDTAGNIIRPGKRFKNEPGGFLKIHYHYSYKKIFTFSTRLELFSSYFDKPGNLDIRWNINSVYKLSKKAAITFTLDVIYDEDALIKEDINGDGIDEIVGPRTQVKETLALGLSINL